MELKKIKADEPYAYRDTRHQRWSRHRLIQVRFPVVVRGFRDAKGNWTDEQQYHQASGEPQRALFLKGEIFDGDAWIASTQAFAARNVIELNANILSHIQQEYDRSAAQRAKKKEQEVLEANTRTLLLKLRDRGIIIPDEVLEDTVDNVGYDDSIKHLIVIIEQIIEQEEGATS